MPVLRNPKYEKFAQLLAAGYNATDAHHGAGFKRHSGNASVLATKPLIKERIDQLIVERAEKAEKAALSMEVTAASLIAECEEARLMAIELKQPQSILAAIKEKGVLSGKRIERSEQG